MQEYINGLAGVPRLGPSPMSPISLLPYLTRDAPYHLLSEHNINVLSDLFPTLSALSKACRTDAGRALLRNYVGEETARRIVDFWNREEVRE
jgi:hypothetical protein